MPMTSMKPLSFLLLIKLLFLGLSVAPFIAGDEHQFSFSGFSNTNLTLDGAASVTPNGLLMLTNGSALSMGHAFYPSPLHFHNLSDGTVQTFCISFVFAIVPTYKDLSSNGLTMFIAPSKNLPAAMPIQFLGLLNDQNNGNETNHIFAIELDTFQNLEFEDINDNHIGIDINSLYSIKSHNAGFYHDESGTFQSLGLDSQEAMQVWVDYHREKTQIDATMAPLGMVKPTRPTVSANYNLSSVLTDVAYIGFSSAQGKINTKHYVLGWSFGMNSPAPAINLTILPTLPSDPHTKYRHRLWLLEIILPLATAALILSVAAVVSLLVRRHFRYAELRDDWEVEFGPHRFSYKDLFHATEGFDDKNLLGAGGFGRVYRGELPRSKLRVAVKRVSHDSKQGMKEFIAEIVSIGRLQNPNLVHLLGYCRRQGELLLVYEYMPKGSLDKYLYGEVNNSTLSWDQRFWIIRGIASALIYLHEEWEKVVVHRDIKASNVLLDDELNARLGDFGLARLYDHGVEQETTRVVGTIGYLAPELARTAKGTPLTDVFAFGVFILEVTYAIDVRLKGHYNVGEAYLALKLGLLCSHPFVCARPSMRQVIQYLDGHIEPPELPAHQSFQALALMQNEGRKMSTMFDGIDSAYSSMMYPIEHTVSVIRLMTVCKVCCVINKIDRSGGGGLSLSGLGKSNLNCLTVCTTLRYNSKPVLCTTLRYKKRASFLPSLLLLLLFGLTIAAFAAGDDQFIFSGFTQSSLALDGGAVVTQGGLLDMSNGTNNVKSHALYPTPLRFRNSSTGGKVQSFSAAIVFCIVGAFPGVSANGLAFFIAPSRNLSDALPTQYFGILKQQNSANLFVIEIDTFQNPDMQDINDNHIGIDINSVFSLPSHAAGFYEDSSGAFKNLTLNIQIELQLWVDYEEEETRINVTLAPLHVGKPSKPLLSATYDLSTVLTETAYIGFSSTAEIMDTRHYVLGWSFGMNGQAAPSIDISKLPKVPRLRQKGQSMLLAIILPIATAALIISIGTIVTLMVRRKRRYREVREDWESEFGPHWFSYKDLFKATQGFKSKNLVGAGGFGEVYRGVLKLSKKEIAVKRMSHESRQGMKEFITEVVSIGRLRHRNLVQLLGYSRRKGELMLVYDYMSNGSLDKYIHCQGDDKPTLNWAQRFQVIKGIATGLLYLHEKWEKVVVHRDIKASNVLLDHEMNGRLGDFGLARLYDHGTDPQSTHMVGTMGYLAPELVRTGKASPLTDVYAFGMFLLEVTCGQKPMKQDAEGNQVFLVDWVLEHWNNRLLSRTVDTRLQGDYGVDEASLVLKIGLLCLHPFPGSRPSMREVMQYLDGETPLPELKPTQLSVDMQGLMQDSGFNTSVMSYPQLMSSFGTVSDLSGGR
ncbi:unnamed protein product [Triticum turgidum subsp. durum]|uniref:non-specific serine/threonine protein kinase n=2 Tax=Triticum turgidum subsp. durum TaxID=4567 RepID=A0A9R0Y829_TRITD|nr:unnamed protein product [Triticum turgidum subsp. durum]